MKDFFTSRFTTIGSYLDTQRFAGADLKKLFSWSYWSETGLSPQTPYGLATLILVIVLVVGLIIWRRRLKNAQASVPIYDPVINQLANIITFVIIMAISYAFFRTQVIAYLSSRWVILVSLIIVLAWLGWVAYQLGRIIPSKRRDYLERERFFRYIPIKKAKTISLKSK